MSYDETLAARVRAVLAREPGITERKMFGGIGFFVRGNMGPGVMGSRLIVKMDKGPAFDEAIAKPHTAPFDFTGRPMRGMFYVEPAGLQGDALVPWVKLSADYARSLPPKAAKAGAGGSRKAVKTPSKAKAGRRPAKGKSGRAAAKRSSARRRAR